MLDTIFVYSQTLLNGLIFELLIADTFQSACVKSCQNIPSHLSYTDWKKAINCNLQELPFCSSRFSACASSTLKLQANFFEWILIGSGFAFCHRRNKKSWAVEYSPLTAVSGTHHNILHIYFSASTCKCQIWCPKGA